jgi:glycosyltransferase involved in cell wall biosynthesis
MKILTVSIAAYNIQKYIEECLNSFISEKLYETLEVLIINDGSTDKTAQIAQRYADKYPDIFKLINKENGGHGSTINTAVKLASGKYFKPVDGDDWIDTKNLVYIIKQLQETDADMVITDFYEYYSNSGEKKIFSCSSIQHEILSDFHKYFTNTMIYYHNITYKTSLLRNNNIHFSEKIFYDDTEFVLFPMPYINTFYYIPLALYYYRLERDGQSISIEGIIKHKADLQQVIINIFHFYRLNTRHGKNKNNFYNAKIISALEFYHDATCTDKWIKSEINNKKANSLFYKNIFFISPSLFIAFVIKSKLRIVQFITFFQFDRQLVYIHNFLRRKHWPLQKKY